MNDDGSYVHSTSLFCADTNDKPVCMSTQMNSSACIAISAESALKTQGGKKGKLACGKKKNILSNHGVWDPDSI